jgi:hypothetical protein
MLIVRCPPLPPAPVARTSLGAGPGVCKRKRLRSYEARMMRVKTRLLRRLAGHGIWADVTMSLKYLQQQLKLIS